MRNLKKALCLVLCFAMMLSVCVMSAGAAFTDQKDVKNTEAVDMCVALNVLAGYQDNTIRPAGNITRAEFCKMICVVLNGGKAPTTSTNSTPTFSDIRGTIAEWAEGYIEYCYAKGVVSGVGNGKFNPQGNVTYTEAAKMLLVALGYNADVERFNGNGWDLYVNVTANQDGLYKDLTNIETSAAATRDNAAQMIWNALQAKVINKESSIDRTDGSITDNYIKSDVDLLAKMYTGKTEEDILSGFKYNSTDKDWTYYIGDLSMKSATDYTALLGMNVKGVYDTSGTKTIKDCYGIFASDSSVILSGVVGNLPNLSATDKDFKVSGVTYKLDNTVAGTNVYAFGPDMAAYPAAQVGDRAVAQTSTLAALAADVKTYDSQKFSAIDQDGDGKIDIVMIYPVSIAKVTSVSSTTVKLSLGAQFSDFDNSVTIADATVYTGIAKDDWVTYTDASNTANDTQVLAKADLVSGKISKKSGSDVTISGTVYTVNSTYGDMPTVGTTMTKAVVYNGYIFSADSTASANASDYVVVTNADYTAAYGATAKLLFSDGSKVVCDIDSASAKPVAGTLCTYEKDSDNEYTLKVVSGVGDATGATDNTAFTGTSSTGSKVAYISGNAILDDSVIFVKYDGGYKAITGATLKTMAKSQFTAVKYLSKNNNASSGVGDINFAYISSSSTDISASDKYYGYVTDVSFVKNADNQTVAEYTMFTNKGEVVLKTTANLTNADEVTTNMVLAYKLNSDGDINSIDALPVYTGAVTQVTSAFMTITGSGTTAANGQHYFDDDAIVITVNTKDEEGVSKDCTYKDIGVADNATKNVFYVLDSNKGDVLFVAYDVDNLLTGYQLI